MLNLDPPPGFRGLDPDKPIHHYFRKLPHWRQNGASYFVTFRLGDSLPQAKLEELRVFKEQFHKKHGAEPSRDEAEKLTKEVMTRVEKWLDQGIGECHLQTPRFANEVVSAMRYFDNRRYELSCFVVMPNHAHAIVKPTIPDEQPLEKILQSWKRQSANQINRLLDRSGEFWQAESFDRIVRDEQHLYRSIQYIGNNPRLAKLNVGEYSLWIKPEWDALGWGFRNP